VTHDIVNAPSQSNTANTISFPVITWAEAVARADDHAPFLVDGLICTTTTVVYGAPNQGKTRLMGSLVASINAGSMKWLGRELTRPVSSIVICAADAGSLEQYVNLIREAAPEPQPAVTFRNVGPMRGPETWTELYASVMQDNPDLVIIDPLTRIVHGSLNEDTAINAVFDGIKPFETAAVPVVLVAHSSLKVNMRGQRQHGPAGSFAIEANGRWFISLYQEGNGDLNLRCYGNHTLTHKLVLRPGEHGATFHVTNVTDGETLLATAGSKKRDRAKKTLDLNLQAAQIIVTSCQGMKQAIDIAPIVAEQLGRVWKPSTVQKKIVPSGPVGLLLAHDGNGGWSYSDLGREAIGRGVAA
jgi:hypothetical protein